MRKATSLAMCAVLVLSMTVTFIPVDTAQALTTYRFAVGSDDHYGYASNPTGARSTIFVNSMVNHSVSRFFMAGDITNDGGPPQYTALHAIYAACGIPFNVTMGNHDPLLIGSKATEDQWGYYGWPYTIEANGIAWIIMRATTTSNLNASALSWLGNELNNHTTDLVFIIVHAPRYQIAYPSVEANDTAFWNITDDHANIGGVFVGHVHDPTSFELATNYVVQGTRTIYCGTTGSNYSETNPLKRYSYLIVDLEQGVAGWNIHLWRQNITTTEGMVAGTELTYFVAVGDATINTMSGLTYTMLLIGIVVAIVASVVVPLANSEQRKALNMQKAQGMLIRTVIFVVVALILLGVVHSVIYGS